MDKPIRWFTPPTLEDGSVPSIKTVSLSRLQLFEQCPRRAALSAIYKVPEPDRPGESPLDRGSRLHKSIEDYIQGVTDELDPEVKHHRDTFIEDFRKWHVDTPAQVEIEERWNFTDDWQTCGDREWDKIWFIVKLDALYHKSEDEAVFVDWKSGKKNGNEVKHADQLLTYAIATFFRYPDVESVVSRMIYIDANETSELEIDRQHAMRFFPRLNNRLLAVTGAQEFPPKPSLSTVVSAPIKQVRS